MIRIKSNRVHPARTEVIHVRMSAKELNDMHVLVEKGFYDTRSQLIRVAVKRLIQWHKKVGDL